MRYVITHGHMFKNAGTTFDYALERAFGRDFLDHRKGKEMMRGGAEYLKRIILENPNLKAISSHHLCNPLPESDEFKCIPVYFVRNPIDRVLSVYNFERKQKKGSKGAEMASKLSLPEYVRWRMTDEAPKVIFDYQTAYIGKSRNLRPSEKVGFEIFEHAVNRIKTGEAIVGVVERFDESFGYITGELERHFEGYEFEYEKKNINNRKGVSEKYRQAIEELESVLPEVIGNNSFDLALYKIANEMLDRMV